MTTRVEVVVLGMLSERPMHGYDVLERFRASGMRCWTELSRASAYQVLKRLERDGLVAGKAQAGREGPDRRVFRITRAGRDRLAAGAVEMAGMPTGPDAAAALGIAHVLPAAAARAALDVRERTMLETLERVRTEIERIAGARDPDRSISIAMLRRQEGLADAELAWLRTFRALVVKARR
jgi:DNA-binding PadR family transcriptional regulator